MSDIMLQQDLEPVVEEEILQDENEEETLTPEEALEELRAAIADIEEKEAVLVEKLCLAKQKGLTVQAEKCRKLLQRVIAEKRAMKEELQEAEAFQLATEIDEFAAAFEEEIFPDPFAEDEALAKTYRSKSKRLGVVSRVIGFVGVLACLVGTIAYLLLCMPEVMNIPFEWIYPAATGAGIVLFLIISLCIGGRSNKFRRMADEIEEEIAIEREYMREEEENTIFSYSHLNAMTEAGDAEAKKTAEMNAPEKKTILSVVKSKIPPVPENIKKNAKVIAPVAAACTAAIAIAAISSSQKKAAQAKRVAAVRKEFFKWLS